MMGLLHGLMARGLWPNQRAAICWMVGAPFYRTYRTSDGKYIFVGAIEPEFFAELIPARACPKSRCEPERSRPSGRT